MGAPEGASSTFIGRPHQCRSSNHGGGVVHELVPHLVEIDIDIISHAHADQPRPAPGV